MNTTSSAPEQTSAPETAQSNPEQTVTDPAAKTDQTQVTQEPNSVIQERELRVRFSKLGRKEQQLQAKEAELTAKLQEYESKYGKYKEVDQLVEKGNRLAALNKLNIQYDDLTRDLITNPRDPAQEQFLALKQEIESIKQERAREIEHLNQIKAQQTEQAARQFVSGRVKALNADLVETIDGGLDMAYQTAIQLLEDGTYKDPVKAADAAIQETNAYYQAQLEKALGTQIGKKYLDSRYDEYVKAKKAEKEKPATLTNRTPVGTPKQDAATSSPFEGKGTAKGLKELMKQQKLMK